MAFGEDTGPFDLSNTDFEKALAGVRSSRRNIATALKRADSIDPADMEYHIGGLVGNHGFRRDSLYLDTSLFFIQQVPFNLDDKLQDLLSRGSTIDYRIDELTNKIDAELTQISADHGRSTSKLKRLINNVKDRIDRLDFLIRKIRNVAKNA